jgi:hypothetical protein
MARPRAPEDLVRKAERVIEADIAFTEALRKRGLRR